MQIKENFNIVLRDHSLLKYNTWRIGGYAKQYYRPSNIGHLQSFITKNKDNFNDGVFILGLGSNVLIRDVGYSGTIIHFYKNFLNCNIVADFDDVVLVRVEAGVTCPQFSKFALQNNLGGVEFLIGIPGTIGGALAMNAGAFGSSTWDSIVNVETIDLRGICHKRDRVEYEISYRKVKPNNEIFVAGTFKLYKMQDAKLVLAKTNQILENRRLVQPIGTFSCGSVFKNPAGLSAGKLIESVRLKGTRIGGAVISEKHANFILNVDHASSQDIEDLIALARQRVYDEHGISLELEVKILGASC